MQGDWSKLDFFIGVDEENKVKIEIKDNENGTEITLRLNHELAASVAEAILVKVAEVEIDIENAVERMIELG